MPEEQRRIHDFKIALPPAVRQMEDWKEGKDFKIPTLYDMIVGHQRTADWWHNRESLEILRQAAFAISVILDLRVKDGVGLGVPLIRVERMNIKTVGLYKPEADGYAFAGTIAFNEARLPDLQPAAVMAYLLKFLLCAWRHHSGGKGVFDQVCREKMKSYGVEIDAKGNFTIERDGKFAADVLAATKIDIPESLASSPPRVGKATSKLWSCNCQRVRVGTKYFFADCPQCGRSFELGDHVGKWPFSASSSCNANSNGGVDHSTPFACHASVEEQQTRTTDVTETIEPVDIEPQPVTSNLGADVTSIVRIVATGDAYLASQGPYEDVYFYIHPYGYLY